MIFSVTVIFGFEENPVRKDAERLYACFSPKLIGHSSSCSQT